MLQRPILRVTKAPLRISFIGGGSDFKTFFEKNEAVGRVLGTAINKFVYVISQEFPAFERSSFRFTYRKTEEVSEIKDIEHPVVRSVLSELDWKQPLNLATMASLPGRSGLGSSSSFTVALLANLNPHFLGTDGDKLQVALEAINIERDVLNEPGGIQDQFHASFGGFRLYEFRTNLAVESYPINDYDFHQIINQHLCLVATGEDRSSVTHSGKLQQALNSKRHNDHLLALSDLALETYNGIQNSQTSAEKLKILARGTNEAWEIKLDLGLELTNETQKIIDVGASVGSLARKLCGAGGSGFVAFLIEDEGFLELKRIFGDDRVFRVETYNSGVSVAEF